MSELMHGVQLSGNMHRYTPRGYVCAQVCRQVIRQVGMYQVGRYNAGTFLHCSMRRFVNISLCLHAVSRGPVVLGYYYAWVCFVYSSGTLARDEHVCEKTSHPANHFINRPTNWAYLNQAYTPVGYAKPCCCLSQARDIYIDWVLPRGSEGRGGPCCFTQHMDGQALRATGFIDSYVVFGVEVSFVIVEIDTYLCYYTSKIMPLLQLPLSVIWPALFIGDVQVHTYVSTLGSQVLRRYILHICPGK